MLKSLDPRIERLGIPDYQDESKEKESLDQLATFQVFVQPREGKAYEHVGIVHAPDLEMALIFAKEQYSRRPGCTGLWVAETKDVIVTPYAEGDENLYDYGMEDYIEEPDKEHYEILHLKKRGKQHIHQGTVLAGNFEEAFTKAKEAFNTGGPVVNIWMIKEKDTFRFHQNDKDIWDMLPEKKHRDVTSYKAMDKVKAMNDRLSE